MKSVENGCHLEVTESAVATDPVLQDAGMRRPWVGDVYLSIKPDGNYSIEWREIDEGDDAPFKTFEIDKSEAAHLLLRFWIPEPFGDLFRSSIGALRMECAGVHLKAAAEDAPKGPVSRAFDVVTKWLEEETRELGEQSTPFRIVR